MNRKQLTGIVAVVLLVVVVIEFDLLPPPALQRCEDLNEPQIMVFNPNVVSGLITTIAVCGLNEEHIYHLTDNLGINSTKLSVVFTDVKYQYFRVVFYEEDFGEDLLLKIWLWDATLKKEVDSKMLSLTLVDG